MSETLYPIEATGIKTLEVKNKNTVHDALTKLASQVQEKENIEAKFQTYLETFRGKANLGMMAEIVNRDLKEAQQGKGSELARKLGLTTLQKVQEANEGLKASAQALAQAKTQEQISKAGNTTPPQTAQAEQAGKPRGISDYVGNSALKERERKAGL